MTLLAPMALWLLLAGGAVVALYLLKIRRRREEVPALDFWLRLAGRTRVHTLFDRLKRLLSMLLWLAVVACLALAVANPILSLGRIKPRAIAVVLDNSASMQAVEGGAGGAGGKTRLELAREALRELTTRRPVTDEWLLIEAAREPRVVQAWTYEPKGLRTAAEGLAPFPGSGDLPAAVGLASQLLEGKPDPCIVVISDGGAGAVETLAKADPRVVAWPVGTTADNLGISRLAVRPTRSGSSYQALLSVVNASDQKAETSVVLTLDGRTWSVEPVTAEPNATWEKTITIDPPGGAVGAVLHAKVDRADALGLDDEAYAVLPPVRPAVVWLVTGERGAFFFEQALGSMDPLVWAEESLTLTPEQYPAALASLRVPAADGKTPVRAPDLIVFNGWAPAALPPSGRFVLVNAFPKDLPLDVAGELSSPQLFLAPRPSPLTQHVTLQGSRVAKARKVSAREPVTVLAHSAENDPLLMLVQGSGGADRQALVVAFDVLDSDLPFRNAFPLLLRNAVAAMHQDAPSLVRPEHRLGEPVTPSRTLGEGVASVEAAVQRGGKTEMSSLPVSGGRFAFTDTLKAGVVRLRAGDEAAFTALSVADAAESRIAPLVLTTGEEPHARLNLSGRLLGAMPWWALAALSLVLITLEWMTYHFRWTE